MRAPHLPAPDKPGHQFDGYGQPTDSSPLFYYDDFWGDALNPRWSTIIVGNATVDVATSNVSGGVAELALEATSESQDAVLDHGDIRSFDVSQGLIFECRLKLTVAPTNGTSSVWGMANDHAPVRDNIRAAAWFRIGVGIDPALDLEVETDDNSAGGNNDNVGLDTVAVLDTYNVYTIDFRDLSDVKFFVDGGRKAMGTTFDMTNLSAAEALMQPYFSLEKTMAAVGTMQIDYVKIWHER